MRFSRKLIATIVITAIISAIPISASAVATLTDRLNWSAGFITEGQRPNGSIPSFSAFGATADAVNALVAAKRNPESIRKAMKFLGNKVGKGDATFIGDQAKVVLAVVASGRNPHNFGGHDLVQEMLDTEQPNGQYGMFTGPFDQADVMLALEAAGVNPSANARQWLVDAQCDDGGWQYDGPPAGGENEHCFTGDYNTDYFQSDTNTTALAVQALALGSGAEPAVDPFTFFTAIRDSQFGGWGYSWCCTTTDANSTGLVIQAYAAEEVPLPTGAMAALKALQYRKCGFAYSWDIFTGPEPFRTNPDIGATNAAILGLLQEPFPVTPNTVTKNAPVPTGCPD